MESIYLNHNQYIDGDVQKMFDYVIQVLKKDRNIKVITFLVYTKLQYEYLSGLFSKSQLKSGNAFLSGYQIQIRTEKNYTPNYMMEGRPADELLIAVCVPIKTLIRFEEFSNIKYWFIVPWQIDEIKEWLQTFEAKDAETGYRIEADYEVDERIKKAVDWLLKTSFPNAGFVHPTDKDRLHEVSNVLKRKNVDVDYMAVVHYCINNTICSSSARKIAQSFVDAKKRAFSTKNENSQILNNLIK